MLVRALEVLLDNTGEMQTLEYSKEESTILLERCDEIINITGKDNKSVARVAQFNIVDGRTHWLCVTTESEKVQDAILRKLYCDKLIKNYPEEDEVFQIFKAKGLL